MGLTPTGATTHPGCPIGSKYHSEMSLNIELLMFFWQGYKTDNFLYDTSNSFAIILIFYIFADQKVD